MKKALFLSLVLLLLNLIAAQPAVAASGTRSVSYIYSDNAGSPLVVTDESGRIVKQYRYLPFGEEQYLVNEATAYRTARLGFAGKAMDTGSGLQYSGARHYDRRNGRFTGVDPVRPIEGNPLSFNRYAYANNNPYKYVDPDGNHPILIILGFGLWINDLANGDGPVSAPGAGLVKNTALAAGKAMAKDAAESPGSVNLLLKFKPDWSDAQRAAACEKCAALTKAETVVTKTKRSGTSASKLWKSGGNTLEKNKDIDHIHDIQLGGSETALSNLRPLDASVNRSLGAQIHHQIKNLPANTRIDRVDISD